MWMRFADKLCCPGCRRPLRLDSFEEVQLPISAEHDSLAHDRGIRDERFNRYVEAGVLLCDACGTMYPILDGLPLLLTYRTGAHEEFMSRHGALVTREFASYRFPGKAPASGEREVMASFSKEWLEYDYDGVIWEMNYEDHEQRFLTEIGPALPRRTSRDFLEVGCGLGITTYLAQKNSGADAVGVDLSLAVWKACRHYRSNPFLHFAQASVFAMPFAEESFDVIYSRGVLHHTESTERAFASTAVLCRPGGTAYIWVYGTGSIKETVFRRAVYGLERAVRPVLSSAPDSLPAKAFLTAMGTGYVFFNGMRRMLNGSIQPLTLSRGVHAARDRFTPRYAHRHETSEVAGWFQRAGFDDLHVLDWKSMPPADHDDFRRNVGVRAVRRPRMPASEGR